VCKKDKTPSPAMEQRGLFYHTPKLTLRIS
jgi:hypothetical protein